MTDWINEIEARCNAASPGPWLTPDEVHDAGLGCTALILDHEGCDCWPWEDKADMIFAYKAREDVPRLIAEIRRLRAQLDKETRP